MTNVFPNAPDRIWATWKEDFGAVQIGTWADTARLAAVRAFIAGQTRHNCGLVRTLREMLK